MTQLRKLSVKSFETLMYYEEHNSFTTHCCFCKAFNWSNSCLILDICLSTSAKLWLMAIFVRFRCKCSIMSVPATVMMPTTVAPKTTQGFTLYIFDNFADSFVCRLCFGFRTQVSVQFFVTSLKNERLLENGDRAI